MMLPTIATAIILSAAWLAWEVWSAPVMPEPMDDDTYLAELARRALAAGEGDEQFHARLSASERPRDNV